MVVNVIQYLASLIKHLRKLCSSESANKFIGRNAEELQPLYSEFSRIVEMFELAKQREDARDWTVIYEKLAEFQNELKSNEHYLCI